MIQTLNRIILRWSQDWRAWFASVLLFALSFQSLFLIGDQFAAVTAGYQPFDLQNPLAVATVLEQLPAYSAASRAIYWLFVLADTIFPALGVLPFALLLGRALRTLSPALAGRGLALVPFVVTLLDWVENVCYVLAIHLYPANVTIWATLGVALKNSKIGFGIISNLVILILALVAAVLWARQRSASGGGKAHQSMEKH
jgi:hypothetical protein